MGLPEILIEFKAKAETAVQTMRVLWTSLLTVSSAVHITILQPSSVQELQDFLQVSLQMSIWVYEYCYKLFSSTHKQLLNAYYQREFHEVRLRYT